MNKVFTKLVALTMTQILIISLAIGSAYYYFFYDNGARFDLEIQKLQESKRAQEKQRSDTESTLKEEQRMKALVGTLAEKLQASLQRIPEELNPLTVDREVTSHAQKVRIRIVAKTPLPVILGEIVDQVPIRISIAEASFAEIAMFLKEVSTSETTLFTAKDFVLQPTGTGSKLRFEGTISGYRSHIIDESKEGKR